MMLLLARRLVTPRLADATARACVAPCAPVATPRVEMHLGVVDAPIARVVVEGRTVDPVRVAQRARIVPAHPRIGAGDAWGGQAAQVVNTRVLFWGVQYGEVV